MMWSLSIENSYNFLAKLLDNTQLFFINTAGVESYP
jgi:hypothetical protein